MLQRHRTGSATRAWLLFLAVIATGIASAHAQNLNNASTVGTLPPGAGSGGIDPVATIFAVPLQVQYQGFLSDDAGQPLNGPVVVHFQLFGPSPDGDTEIWSETHTLNANQGQIEVILGTDEPLSPAVLNRPELELAVSVGGSELSPRAPLTSVPYAILSADSERLAGQTSGQVVQQAVQRIAEPASPADIVLGFEDIGGQASEAQIPDSISRNADLEQQFYSRSEVDALVATLSQRIDQLQAQVDGQSGGGGDLPPDDELDARIDARVAAATELLGGALKLPKAGSVFFEGVDVFITNGEGETDTSNGKGNLIVGYNEINECIPRPPTTCPPALRTGSHNLILGQQHSYTHWGGILSGSTNASHAEGASVLGGNNNLAEARNAVILAGSGNSATGIDSAVIAGTQNTSEGDASVVVSGADNRSIGVNSAILSGFENTTFSEGATIVAGQGNEVRGLYSSVVGGSDNTVTDATDAAVVVGGRGNTTSAIESALLGGNGVSLVSDDQPVGGLGENFGDSLLDGALTREGDEVFLTGVNLNIVNGTEQTASANALGNLIIGYNETRDAGNARTGSHNLILGARQNFTASGGLALGQGHTLTGLNAAAVGGFGNQVSGADAIVVGGQDNLGDGISSVVVGGQRNLGDGLISTVIGGEDNTASALKASVFGGSGNTATAREATTLGGLGNQAGAENSTVTGGHYRRSGQ